MPPPRPLVAVCLVLLGLLAWTVEGRPPPSVRLAEAEVWEGQAVRLEGWAQGVSRDAAGTLRLDLVDGGHVVPVRLAAHGTGPPGPAGAPVAGERLSVEGRLGRLAGGQLVLFAEDPGSLRRIAEPAAERPTLRQVAEDPQAWAGRLLELAGTVERGHLRGDGVRLAAGEGPWPRDGPTRVTGLLRYEPDCACHAFDAREVRPWTP